MYNSDSCFLSVHILGWFMTFGGKSLDFIAVDFACHCNQPD